MDLPDALRRQKENFLQKVPGDIVSIMNEATTALSQSGIEQNCLQTGDKAPDFKLEDSNGNTILLREVRRQGPVILKFFRGDW